MFELAGAAHASTAAQFTGSRLAACYARPMLDAYSFAQLLVAELRERCPEAAPLRAHKGRGNAEIGIDDEGEFQPLLRVANASKACNVMSLWVRHHNRWQPTFVRGAPDQLADKLAGPYAYLWRIAVIAMGFEDQ